MAEIAVEIVNKKGLHARAAAKFVKTVGVYAAEVTVSKSDSEEKVTGSSILGLMMLGADAGSTLHITATGEQAEAVLAALKELISHGFGEGD